MEKKDIKQFLHLYLGCEVSVTNIEGRYTKIIDYDFFQSYYDEEGREFLNDPKICLRPLSSMTEEEERHMISTQDTVKLDGYPQIVLKADSGETFRWMLSKSFDLFGLIESGLAIDSTLKPV